MKKKLTKTFKKWEYFYTASAERSDPAFTKSENLDDILDKQMEKNNSLCLFLFIVSVYARSSIRITLQETIIQLQFLSKVTSISIHTPNGAGKTQLPMANNCLRLPNIKVLVYVYGKNNCIPRQSTPTVCGEWWQFHANLVGDWWRYVILSLQVLASKFFSSFGLKKGCYT